MSSEDFLGDDDELLQESEFGDGGFADMLQEGMDSFDSLQDSMDSMDSLDSSSQETTEENSSDVDSQNKPIESHGGILPGEIDMEATLRELGFGNDAGSDTVLFDASQPQQPSQPSQPTPPVPSQPKAQGPRPRVSSQPKAQGPRPRVNSHINFGALKQSQAIQDAEQVRQIAEDKAQQLKNKKLKASSLGKIRKEGFGKVARQSEKENRRKDKSHGDIVMIDPENDGIPNEDPEGEPAEEREERRQLVIEQNTRGKNQNEYALYEGLEDTIRGPVESYNQLIPGSTCDTRMEEFVTYKTTAVEKNCIKKAVQQCVDFQRMKVLRSKIPGKSASDLDLKDYELVQLANSITQHYKSLFGKAMNMIAKVQAPTFKRKIKSDDEDEADAGGADRGGYVRTAEGSIDKRKIRAKKNNKKKDDDDETIRAAEESRDDLTDEQKIEKARIDNRMKKYLDDYTKAVKDITEWAIVPDNLEYLIPISAIPETDLKEWALDLKRDHNKKEIEAQAQKLPIPQPMSEKEYFLQRRVQIMKSILHGRFNISKDEMDRSRQNLESIVEFDYTQHPSVKRMKTLKIQSGYLSTSEMYFYSWTMANVSRHTKDMVDSLVNQMRTSVALLMQDDNLFSTKVESVIHGSLMSTENLRIYAENMFRKNLQRVSANYSTLTSKANLDYRSLCRDISSSGIVIPPVTQFTYPVVVRGRNNNICNMMMWPDRILWSYDSDQGIDITLEHAEAPIRAVIYNDLLDPYYRSWRKPIFGSELGNVSKIHRMVLDNKNTSVSMPTSIEEEYKYVWDTSDISIVDPTYSSGIFEEQYNDKIDNMTKYREKMLATRRAYQQKWTDTYNIRLTRGLNAFPNVMGEFVNTGETTHWFDVFTGTSGGPIRVAPSEHTFYTDSWTNTTDVTLGSFITVKEHIIPHIIDPSKLEVDIAGSALYMTLVEVPGKETRNVWFKDVLRLRKKKDSSKDEKRIDRSQGYFPKMLELDALCEGGLVTSYKWDKPEILALLFKALSSFIYKVGQDEAMQYLIIVRMNKLQKFGNMNDQKLIYILRKYLDFGVCIDADIKGDSANGVNPMYPQLSVGYLMYDRKWSYSRVIGVDQQMNSKHEVINVPQMSNFSVEIDPSEVWLMRMMPSTEELWKLFQFCYQDYFWNVCGAKYIRKLFDFMYADVEMVSGDMKLATETGKILEEFSTFKNSKNAKRNVPDFHVRPISRPDPVSLSGASGKALEEKKRHKIPDYSFDEDFTTSSPIYSSGTYQVEPVSFNVPKVIHRQDTPEEESEDEERTEDVDLFVAPTGGAMVAITKSVETPEPIPGGKKKKKPIVIKEKKVKEKSTKTSVKIPKSMETIIESKILDTYNEGKYKVPKFLWLALSSAERIQLADFILLHFSDSELREHAEENLANRIKELTRNYHLATPKGKLLYMKDEVVNAYRSPLPIPEPFYDRLTDAQKSALARDMMLDHKEFNKRIRSIKIPEFNGPVYTCDVSAPINEVLESMTYDELVERIEETNAEVLYVPQYIIQNFKPLIPLPKVVKILDSRGNIINSLDLWASLDTEKKSNLVYYVKTNDSEKYLELYKQIANFFGINEKQLLQLANNYGAFDMRGLLPNCMMGDGYPELSSEAARAPFIYDSYLNQDVTVSQRKERMAKENSKSGKVQQGHVEEIESDESLAQLDKELDEEGIILDKDKPEHADELRKRRIEFYGKDTEEGSEEVPVEDEEISDDDVITKLIGASSQKGLNLEDTSLDELKKLIEGDDDEDDNQTLANMSAAISGKRRNKGDEDEDDDDDNQTLADMSAAISGKRRNKGDDDQEE
jgi:hypothetical protein